MVPRRITKMAIPKRPHRSNVLKLYLQICVRAAIIKCHASVVGREGGHGLSMQRLNATNRRELSHSRSPAATSNTNNQYRRRREYAAASQHIHDSYTFLLQQSSYHNSLFGKECLQSYVIVLFLLIEEKTPISFFCFLFPSFLLVLFLNFPPYPITTRRVQHLLLFYHVCMVITTSYVVVCNNISMYGRCTSSNLQIVHACALKFIYSLRQTVFITMPISNW